MFGHLNGCFFSTLSSFKKPGELMRQEQERIHFTVGHLLLKQPKYPFIELFQANVQFLYPLKMLENL